jgi:hypothetical protein
MTTGDSLLLLGNLAYIFETSLVGEGDSPPTRHLLGAIKYAMYSGEATTHF